MKLKPPPDILSRTGPARRRPFILSTPHALARGVETTGIEEVSVDGLALLGPVRPVRGGPSGSVGKPLGAKPPASNIVLTPTEMRREVSGAGGSTFESVILPEGVPAVLLQWGSEPTRRAPAIAFAVPTGDGFDRPDGRHLLIRGSGGIRLYRISPAPETWSFEEGDTAMRVTVVPPEDATVLELVAAFGPSTERARSILDSAARCELAQTRAETTLRALREDYFALHTGVVEIDDAIEWAKGRLAAPRRTSPTGLPLHLLGCLTSGQHAMAAALLDARPGGGMAFTDVIGLGWAASWGLPVGRWAPSPAELEALVENRPDIRNDTLAGVLTLAAEAAAADILDALHERERARALRTAAARAESQRSRRRIPTGAGRVLPVAGGRAPGGAPGHDLTAALAAVLGVPFSAPPGDTRSEALRAWALYARGRAEEAYAPLRTALRLEAAGETADEPDAPALLVAATVLGLLGVRPDAPTGRIRLAPAFPTSWTRMRATSLRVGPSVLDLDYAAEAGGHTFVLRPIAGAVPATVVFEPSVAGEVRAVEVDGTETDIVPERTSERTTVRLQIPLDQDRRVTLVRSAD